MLGATGSVGTATVDVLLEHPTRWRVRGLAAGRRGSQLLELGRRFEAEAIALVDEQAAEDLRPSLRAGDPELRVGKDGLLSLLSLDDVHIVVQGISGAAGLDASLETVRLGHRLALANKESMVVAGPILLEEAKRTGAEILPVDSEHSALYQCLHAGRAEDVRRLILTASGGPFRGRRADQIRDVTPAEALKHPTWDMGNASRSTAPPS